METNPFFILKHDGTVAEANEEAFNLVGISSETLLNKKLIDHMFVDHRSRFNAELSALLKREEIHGRVNCTIIGLDDVARRLTLRMFMQKDGTIHVDLSSNIRLYESPTYGEEHSLANPERLLPVARRMSAICRHSRSKEDLLHNGLMILAEVTSANSGAAIEWQDTPSDWPITAMFGSFDENLLEGVFRSAVIGRLTRGDVIVKDLYVDGTVSNNSMILVPLVATETPEGILALNVEGYTVLNTNEQQSVGMLGEIMGLGLRAISPSSTISDDLESESPSDGAKTTTYALGRLTAGLAHEINNATTVLRNNVEQFATHDNKRSRSSDKDWIVRDSINAVETIKDLTAALRAFAPEESKGLEETDLLRIIEVVLASIRFYAKRSIFVSLECPEGDVPPVYCRSHLLIRALFLVFVDLVESASKSGNVLNVKITLTSVQDAMNMTLFITSGTFSMPTILLSQIERDGTLYKNLTAAGATLAHEISGGTLSMAIAIPLGNKKPKKASIIPTEVRHIRRGTILIVDDEPPVIRSTRRLLQKNHDVLAARSGPEALEIVRSNTNIDVILLDVLMPGMNGQEVLEEFKRLQPDLVNRVVFITGGAADEEVNQYIQQSSQPVMEKPLDIPELNELISWMIK